MIHWSLVSNISTVPQSLPQNTALCYQPVAIHFCPEFLPQYITAPAPRANLYQGHQEREPSATVILAFITLRLFLTVHFKLRIPKNLASNSEVDRKELSYHHFKIKITTQSKVYHTSVCVITNSEFETEQALYMCPLQNLPRF